MTRVALYARFSNKEKQNARSITDQFAICRDYAKRKGWRVVAEYADHGVSAASIHGRDEFQRMTEDAKARAFDIVLAEDLDRLSRNQADIAYFYQHMTFRDVQIFTIPDGLVTEMHVGLKGTMNAMDLKRIGDKTRRGQMGRARAGKIPGGRCYGYDVTGKGSRSINETEARIIRHIYRDYKSGMTPREIAAALNRQGVPSPRGGEWTASAINGSATRRNGILNNELYRGRVVYNRQSFRKDPDTGKRQSRINDKADWIITKVPELRIVTEPLWDAVRARKDANTLHKPGALRRPPRLLSGLLVCGQCGGGYTIIRDGFVGCSARREKGTCDNARIAPIDDIETRVLNALRTQLLSPKVVANSVRAYHDEMKQLARTKHSDRAALDRAAGETARKIGRIISAIEDGAGETGSLVARLRDLEEKASEIEAKRAESEGGQVIAIHPRAAKAYAHKIEAIQWALKTGDEEMRRRGMDHVRALIARVVVIPHKRPQPVGLEIEGQLAALLAPPERQGLQGRGMMVAGARFELATFRL